MIIESGLVKAGLVKTGLVRAISSINTRYFRRNEGTTDYATIPEVTLTGDFVIEFDVYLDVDRCHILSNNAINATGRIFYEESASKIEVSFDTAAITFDVQESLVGVFAKVMLFRESGVVGMLVNGVSRVPSGNTNSDLTLNSIGAIRGNTTSVPALSGILANLKIWDNGTLIRDYPLDDNSDDLRELANGQNGTVINGNASDWGLFQQQSTGEWLGQELATISSTPILGDDSDPEFITITSSIILGQSFRLGANFSNSGSSAAGCGWSTSRGVPTTPPFRSTSWVVGDFVGGDFSAISSGIQQLFGRGGLGAASYDNVSVKEVLSVA